MFSLRSTLYFHVDLEICCPLFRLSIHFFPKGFHNLFDLQMQEYTMFSCRYTNILAGLGNMLASRTNMSSALAKTWQVPSPSPPFFFDLTHAGIDDLVDTVKKYVNRHPAMRSVGQNPKKKKYKKRRFNQRVPSVLTLTMAPTGACRVILSASHPGMWEVNDRWSYGFPTCMGGILGG